MQRKKTVRIALIGEKVSVIGAANKSLVGITGKVTDETKNTLVISTEKGNKTIIKDQVAITVNEKTIQGKNIMGRTETRIKQ